MVYAFTLPTTSPLSFQSFVVSSTHPSLPHSASAARHALRLALRTLKRLPRGPRQDAHLPTVLCTLNDYLPYLFAVYDGLSDGSGFNDLLSSGSPTGRSSRSADPIEITLHTGFESAWKPTLSANSAWGHGTLAGSSGISTIRRHGGRVLGQGINFEIAFTLATLGYVLSRLARSKVAQALYASTTQTTEQRTAALQIATKYLLQASSVHSLLASSPAFSVAMSSAAPDIDPATQSALSSLALAEATLLAVLKDDAYTAACIQARNPNDREWMIRAPEIPKVRALLFSRLCVRAAEYAEQSAASFGSIGSGISQVGRVDEGVMHYAVVLGRVARARACRFLAVDAELAGNMGEGIAWLGAARSVLGLRGGHGSSQGAEEPDATRARGGLSRLKREWAERREDRKIAKNASANRNEEGALESGDDAGRGEEGRVIAMLETKWVRINNTMNTQPVPPSGPLLSNLPSGRDIHTPPASFQPPHLDEDLLLRMRAPPDQMKDAQYAYDLDDSEDDTSVEPRGPIQETPDRSQSASNVYY